MKRLSKQLIATVVLITLTLAVGPAQPAPGAGAATVLPDGGSQVHGVNFMLKTFVDATVCVETDVAVNTTPRVYLATCTGRANQRWTFTDGEDGSSVVVGDRGFCLNVERGPKPQMLGIATCDYRADQRFEVTPAGLIMERHSDNCLTVRSPLLSGAPIFVEECQDPMVADQAWRLVM